MRQLPIVVAIAATWLFYIPSGEADAFGDENYPSADFRAGVEIKPNVTLPDHVPASPGQLSCYADFAARSEKGVPIYIVNRTDKAINFDSQDGDIYLKLEEELPDGSWKRAQAHRGSDCGNSYGLVSLPPGQHITTRGYSPNSGVKSRVRYSRYADSQLVSNDGGGYVLQSDIKDAEVDPIGRQVSQPIDTILDARWNRSHDPGNLPSVQVAALRLVQADGENPYFRQAAENLAQFWETKQSPNPAEAKGAKEIRLILAEQWPKKRSREALLARCFAAISSPDNHESAFGWPETHSQLVGQVLADLPHWQNLKDPALWKPLRDYLLGNPETYILQSLTGVFANRSLVDELLPNEFFEKNIYSSDPALQKACAQTLSRRGQRDRLVTIGWSLPQTGQVIVLGALANPFDEDNESYVGMPYETNERMFWSYCLKTLPLESVVALNTALGYRNRENSPYDRLVHDPLHDLISAEADKHTGSDIDFSAQGYEWKRLVDFLASWNLEEDNGIFQKLLAHGGYTKSECWEGTTNRHYYQYNYLIRTSARQALMKRGLFSPDIVLKKEIPIVKQ